MLGDRGGHLLVVALGHVGDVEHRLGRQRREVAQRVGRRVGHGHVARRTALAERGQHLFEPRLLGDRHLVAGARLLDDAFVTALGLLPYSGRGPRPKSPWTRVDRWCAAVPPQAWTTIDVRDGEQGPLVVEAVKVRVLAKSPPGDGNTETLVVIRERQADGTMKHDYYLSNAPHDTPLAEFARVAKAAHRIEECLDRAKGEAGLADYEVRTWRGWHHHQTLSLLATWFLTQETRRGKKIHSGDHRPASPCPAGFVAA